ncbi:MAG: glycosyltransferase family 4 protein, partial [bacterium]
FEYPLETQHGGIATYTYHTARCMAQLGHDVTVITCSPTGNSREITDKGVRIILIPPGKHVLPSRPSAYPVRLLVRYFAEEYLNAGAWAREAADTFKDLDSKEKFDILEYPETKGEGYFTESTTCRKVVRLHMSFPLLCRFNLTKLKYWDRRLISFVERSGIKKADQIVSPSDAYKNVAALLWRIPHDKIEVLPNLIHTADFKEPVRTEQTNFTVLARIEPNKGIHHILKFFSFYQRDFKNLRLKFIGRDTGLYKKGELRNIVKQSGMKDSIEFCGHVNTEAVKRAIAESLAVFLPSTWENLPYSCLESMAMGRVVFGTVNGGIKEIIKNGKNGFLFDVTNYNDLKDKLDIILNDGDKRREIEKNAQKIIEENFSAQVLGPKYEEFYKKVTEKSDIKPN